MAVVVRSGPVVLVWVRRVWLWQAGRVVFRRGQARSGAVRHGSYGELWQGEVRRGDVWRGKAGKARHNEAWYGLAWQGMAGMARRGAVWCGVARLGEVRRGSPMIKKKEEGRNMVYEYVGYKWKLPAQVVGETLERIHREQGEVTNENFLDASRPQESITHELFEWDDTTAAEKWRLAQAGRIISCTKIVVQSPVDSAETKKVTVRAFVNKSPDDGKTHASYVPFEEAMEKQDYREIVIANAKKDFIELANKYRVYKEFEGVVSAIDNLTV